MIRDVVPDGISRSTPVETIARIVLNIQNPFAIPLPPRDLRREAILSRIPEATDLPVSLAFVGVDGALEPVYARGFKMPRAEDDGARWFIRRLGQHCLSCNSKKGDAYEYVLLGDDGEIIGRETRYARGNQAAHRWNCPSRCGDADLMPLCPTCHGHSDSVHRWSAAALTRAAEPTGTRLTVLSLQRRLSRVREAAYMNPGTPLAAMGVGGSDLLIAHALNEGMPLNAESLQELIPEVSACRTPDITQVISACLQRLRMRGLLIPGKDVLCRPLTLPEHITETPPPVNPKRNRRLSSNPGYAVHNGAAA